jgi:hypothetical protein
MHHPDLLAALAQDKVRQCPCGAVADRPFGLCRKCQARGAWRRKTHSRHRQAARGRLGHRIRHIARLLVGVMCLLLPTSRGLES